MTKGLEIKVMCCISSGNERCAIKKERLLLWDFFLEGILSQLFFCMAFVKFRNRIPIYRLRLWCRRETCQVCYSVNMAVEKWLPVVIVVMITDHLRSSRWQCYCVIVENEWEKIYQGPGKAWYGCSTQRNCLAGCSREHCAGKNIGI